ncbi:unnamed protein product [Alopecurus aequalis]
MANACSSSFIATSDAEPWLTASAIVAPVVSGSHILRIDGYSRTKGLGNGKFIASETFTVGGHRWCLRYYPDGRLLTDYDWISILVQCDHSAVVDEVKASFRISLLDQDGDPVPSYSHESTNRIFSSRQDTMGFDIIKRSDLEASDCLRDDVFSVRCNLTVAKEIYSQPLPVSQVRR